MFLQEDDLKNSIYGYQVDQITEGDSQITLQAMLTAEQEARSYLAANNKREWSDGRLKYDLDKIFTAVGKNRNPLLVSVTVTVAKWWIVDLCNADIIYEHAKERYDRSIAWLTKLAKGQVNLDNLPLIEKDNNIGEESTEPWLYGSREKFNHE